MRLVHAKRPPRQRLSPSRLHGSYPETVQAGNLAGQQTTLVPVTAGNCELPRLLDSYACVIADVMFLVTGQRVFSLADERAAARPGTAAHWSLAIWPELSRKNARIAKETANVAYAVQAWWPALFPDTTTACSEETKSRTTSYRISTTARQECPRGWH
jgi:hypothetical protein